MNEWDWQEILGTAAVVVPQIIAVGSAISMVTPTKVDDAAIGGLGRAWNVASRLINWSALNVGKAKNADDR